MHPNRRRRVIGLVNLPFVLVCGVSRTFRNGPSWLVSFITGIGAVFRVVGSGTHDLRGRVKADQGVKSFDCAPVVQTELRSTGSFGLDDGVVLWPRSHLVLFLVDRQSGGASEPSVANVVSPDFVCLVDVQLSEGWSTSMSLRK